MSEKSGQSWQTAANNANIYLNGTIRGQYAYLYLMRDRPLSHVITDVLAAVQVTSGLS